MIEYLVGRGETEAASTVAGIFAEHVDPKLKFMTSASAGVQAASNHFSGDMRTNSMTQKVKVDTGLLTNLSVCPCNFPIPFCRDPLLFFLLSIV